DVDRQVEALPAAREVLVQLAACRIDRPRRAQHAHAERLREAVELALGVRVVRDSAEATLGRRDEQRADRGVDQVVGDVEQVLARGRVPEATVEFLREGSHWVSFRRSLRMPAEAAWRAAVAFEPSAAPMSA